MVDHRHFLPGIPYSCIEPHRPHSRGVASAFGTLGQLVQQNFLNAGRVLGDGQNQTMLK
jgi:hypothetical protein